jgi:hypothetical protein
VSCNSVFGLPFREVWALDFEFHISEPGALPVPICMVARELGSGRLLRMWLWGTDFGTDPPFATDAGVLFVAHAVSLLPFPGDL